MMSPLVGHLVLLSVGLLAVGGVLALILLVSRKDPVVCYRQLVALLMAALLLPVGQFVVQGRAASSFEGWSIAHFTSNTSPEPSQAIGELGEDPGVLLGTSRMAGELLPASVSEEGAGGWRESWAKMPVLACYLPGVLFLIVLYGFRYRRTRQLLKEGRPVRDAKVLSLWLEIAGNSPRCKVAEVVTSGTVQAPACWGWWRPKLILPQNPGAVDRATLEWALLHERVHLERGDPKIAVLQALFTCLFWFHPVAWLLSRQLDRYREMSCDHLVVARSGRRRSYARALLSYAEGRVEGSLKGPTVAVSCPTLLPWSSSAAELRRRIRMLSLQSQSWSRSQRWMRHGVAGLALLAVGGSQLSVAAALLPRSPSDSEEEEPQKSRAEEVELQLLAEELAAAAEKAEQAQAEKALALLQQAAELDAELAEVSLGQEVFQADHAERELLAQLQAAKEHQVALEAALAEVANERASLAEVLRAKEKVAARENADQLRATEELRKALALTRHQAAEAQQQECLAEARRLLARALDAEGLSPEASELVAAARGLLMGVSTHSAEDREEIERTLLRERVAQDQRRAYERVIEAQQAELGAEYERARELYEKFLQGHQARKDQAKSKAQQRLQSLQEALNQSAVEHLQGLEQRLQGARSMDQATSEYRRALEALERAQLDKRAAGEPQEQRLRQREKEAKKRKTLIR